MKRIVLTGLTAAFMGACASVPLTPEEVAAQCSATDWYAVGVSAGAKAKPLESLASRKARCAEVGLAPDVSLVEAGWNAGLDRFCTPESVLEASLKRGANAGVCRDPYLSDLAAVGAAHRAAESRLRSAESHLDGLHTTIRRNRKKIAKRRGEILDLKDQLKDPATPEAGKPEIRHAIVKFEDKIATYRKRIRRARRDIPRAESDVRVAVGVFDESAALMDMAYAELAR